MERETTSDLASIRISRSVVGSSTRTTVYTGLGTTFTSRRLKNGSTYRFVFVALDRAGNSSQPVVVSATPIALLLASPRPGASVLKPPALRWARVPSARYFNVQIYRGGKKILSARKEQSCRPDPARLSTRSGSPGPRSSPASAAVVAAPDR